MKFAMSPARAYLLGMWKSRRTAQGFGVTGRRELQEVFVKLCLDEKLAVADKIKFIDGTETEEGACYFYNSALRTHFDSEMEKRADRLKYKNEFAANYFAGVFDARGGFYELKGKEYCYLLGDETDELVLLRLGFRSKKEGRRIAVLADDFYGWLHPYLRLERSKKF